ncbi:MAG: hypothetical protein WA193_10350 [Candidatus Acidiferrales bacterium]
MGNSYDNPRAKQGSYDERHDEFVELCALSTSGDLTDEEQNKLRVHLAACGQCRDALMEFHVLVDKAIPLLASDSFDSEAEKDPAADAAAEVALFERLSREGRFRELGPAEENPVRVAKLIANRNGQSRSFLNWNYVWMPFAACILLTITLAIYAYRVGRARTPQVIQGMPNSAHAQVDMLEQKMSDIGHERAMLKAQLIERDKVITKLRKQAEQQTISLNAIKSTQDNLEQSLQSDQVEQQRLKDERAGLAQRLDAAQASLQKVLGDLDSAQQQRLQDQLLATSLEAQIDDVSRQLGDRKQTIERQEELLSHDRDIRELMGARDLYIAEVYDVARTGAMQKPYGRVFYTKGKSLIFYAYDLNQEAGVQNASTFQVWGRRGPDKTQALNLGIFYQDSAAKKRWVLRFDDPKALEQIDAVFVTVEPSGGSQKPSGKALLFASLRVESNHP